MSERERENFLSSRKSERWRGSNSKQQCETRANSKDSPDLKAATAVALLRFTCQHDAFQASEASIAREAVYSCSLLRVYTRPREKTPAAEESRLRFLCAAALLTYIYSLRRTPRERERETEISGQDDKLSVRIK